MASFSSVADKRHGLPDDQQVGVEFADAAGPDQADSPGTELDKVGARHGAQLWMRQPFSQPTGTFLVGQVNMSPVRAVDPADGESGACGDCHERRARDA